MVSGVLDRTQKERSWRSKAQMPKNRKVSARGHSDSRVLKKQELKESPGTPALSGRG